METIKHSYGSKYSYHCIKEVSGSCNLRYLSAKFTSEHYVVYEMTLTIDIRILLSISGNSSKLKFIMLLLILCFSGVQSGRFGKLNKRVTFPETLDLSPYMSEAADSNDKYKLYAVVVHVDMLNASYFGHYICYTKDFSGNWYRIDDCKVRSHCLCVLYVCGLDSLHTT